MDRLERTLASRLLASARAHAERPAVYAGTEVETYAQLFAGAERVAAALRAASVGPKDRVAIWMEKSIPSLKALLGTLLAGAAYVPIDPKAPALRALGIARDAAVAAACLDRLRLPHREEIAALPSVRRVLAEGEDPLDGAPSSFLGADLALEPREEDPAYVLYTSGSTGRPKGVVLSNRAALAFVDWCVRTFRPTADDRMTSHAPYHFDLSTFDLFVTLTTGASVRLLRSTEVMLPRWIAGKLEEWGITFWYSVPAALIQMRNQAALSADRWPSARVVLFAGEVYPTPELRALRRALPQARLVNLYGPTETNVCTFYEVGPIEEGDTRPIPIGRVCEHLEGAILDDEGREVPRGTEGDLWIGGANLLTEYWGDPELTRGRLRPDPRPGRSGLLYLTGDRVKEREDGNLLFHGRRDHMVKVRGYRVELGEVESALHAHGGIAEAVVVAIPDPETGHRLDAWVVLRAGRDDQDSAIKAQLKELVPLYMVPERVRVVPSLPRTSNGKVDRVALLERSRAAEV